MPPVPAAAAAALRALSASAPAPPGQSAGITLIPRRRVSGQLANIRSSRGGSVLDAEAGGEPGLVEDLPAAVSRSRSLWKRVSVAVRQANLLIRLGLKGPEVDEPDAGQKSVEHLLDVSVARRKFAQYQYQQHKQLTTTNQAARKKLSPHRRGSALGARGHKASAADGQGFQMLAVPMKRRKLLRIGTVGAFQYFGDRQVSFNEVYPVSLVSDPMAEIYLMSKHDILRRLPRKLFDNLFNPDNQGSQVPSDTQILDMHRQAERWNAFRGSMHAESLGSRQYAGAVPRPLRDFGVSRSRVDPLANLDFLGVSPHSVPEVLPPPQKRTATLSAKDEELFSQASAGFLRKFDVMKKDRGLRGALARDGVAHLLPCADDDELDPMAFRFEQNWSRLGKVPMLLDLQEEEAENASAAVSPVPPGGASGRQSMSPQQQRGARRSSIDSNIDGSVYGGSSPRPSQGQLKLSPQRSRASGASGSGPGLGAGAAERVFGNTGLNSQSTLAPGGSSSSTLPPLGTARGSTSAARPPMGPTRSNGSSVGPPHTSRERRRTALHKG